jgi:hypothetical protein
VPDVGGALQSVDPSCGETYRSLDPAACAAAIHMILDRNPEELRDRAVKAAQRVHTAEAHFNIVLSTYDELLKEKYHHSLRR